MRRLGKLIFATSHTSALDICAARAPRRCPLNRGTEFRQSPPAGSVIGRSPPMAPLAHPEGCRIAPAVCPW